MTHLNTEKPESENPRGSKKHKEPAWIAQVKETADYHRRKLKENNGKWGLKQTAEALNRALGAISQDLQLASWLRTHESELLKFEFKHDAMAYVRKRKRTLAFDED